MKTHITGYIIIDGRIENNKMAAILMTSCDNFLPIELWVTLVCDVVRMGSAEAQLMKISYTNLVPVASLNCRELE